MKHEIAMLLSQKLTTCPYPKPGQHSPHHSKRIFVPFQYYTPIYACLFQVFSFLQVSPIKTLSSFPYLLHHPWSDHSKNIRWAVQIINLLATDFFLNFSTPCI